MAFFFWSNLFSLILCSFKKSSDGLVFLLQQIFNYVFLKKWNFGIIPIIFTIFLGKNRSRRHLPLLSKLTSLFSKTMSKFRANNHFLFVLIFYSQVRKNDFWHFCYEVYRFSQLKMLRSNFSPLMSIIWAF